jgi:hypothetical protein
MSKVIKEILVSEIYHDRSTGEEKKKWHKIGVVLENERGVQYGKIDLFPVGWDGFFGLFDPKPREERQPGPPGQPTPPIGTAPAPITGRPGVQASLDALPGEDDLPF